jgi:toxin ParE1/3/4
MSVPDMRITLSRTASAEFKGILNYTGKTWGKEQRKRYKETLWNGFRNIAAFPFIGESRPEYGESARIHRIDVYVVIYEPMENEIIISRIIHQRRAIELLLGDEFE